MKTQISDGTITLKKYEMEFAPLLYNVARESTGGEFTRWMPWCHENYTLAESEYFIEGSIENWKTETEFDYAIFLNETNKFVGGISLNLFNWQRKLSNLGYWVSVGSQNQGIAHTATKMLVENAFQDTDLNRIEIVVATENYVSQKTAEKSGAIREGVLRQLISVGGTFHDAVVFSFLRSDFD
jgi:ribosomal-protein-serine acetyltransferase